MFRWTDLERNVEVVDGLIGSDSWQAEKTAAALSAIAYEETIFAVDERLGWHADLVGEDSDLERALSRVLAVVVSGDVARVADAVRTAVRTRRIIERAVIAAENSTG
jgi:hypothetical protein